MKFAVNMSRIDQLQSFLKDSPNDSFIIFAIAKEFEKTGDLHQAEKQYRLIHKNEPEYVGMYYHLGKLLFNNNDLQGAWKIYSEGMQVAKQQGDQHALNELAGARLEIDEDDLE